MLKLRALTLVPLLIVAVLSACTPSGDLDIESAALSDISVEDAAVATVKAMSIEGAVEATLQAMAPEATETPTPQPIGQAPTPNNQSVSTPTVVIETAATSTVTESTGAVTGTATVVIEVPAPTSTVTSGLVSSLATPVVQVATPTSIVSASIGTVTATAAVIPTTVPIPVPVPTPIPEPTATPTPTPVPYSYNIIEGTTPIGTSGYNYPLQGFFVEDYDLISELVSTQIKWGDSNDYTQVSVMQGTGEILANHTFTSGGAFYGEIRLVSISTGEVLASQTITIVMDLGDIPTAVPTISVIEVATSTSIVTPTIAVIEVATPTSTVSGGATPTFTPTVGPTPTPAPPTVSMITYVEFPRWSPDGSKMIFSGNSTDASGRNIWVLDFDGSNLTRLTDPSEFDGDAARDPDWSVNNKIVFSVKDLDVWTMNADGSGKSETGIRAAAISIIGSEYTRTYSPVWSPDGNQIAFYGKGVVGDRNVWVAGPGWSNLKKISSSIDGFTWANYPEWSPDGTKLCFAVRTVNGSTTATQIYIANSDGTGDMVRLDAEADDSFYCAWDSTSDKMAYDDNDEWYVVNNSSGAGKVALTNNGHTQGLDWRPDGSRILFAAAGGLYSIKPDGSDKITHISGD